MLRQRTLSEFCRKLSERAWLFRRQSDDIKSCCSFPKREEMRSKTLSTFLLFSTFLFPFAPIWAEDHSTLKLKQQVHTIRSGETLSVILFSRAKIQKLRRFRLYGPQGMLRQLQA